MFRTGIELRSIILMPLYFNDWANSHQGNITK